LYAGGVARASRLEATGLNVSAGGTCIKTCAAESVKLAGGSFVGHASVNMGERVALIVTGQSKLIIGRRIVTVVGGGSTLTAESLVPCAGRDSSALSVTVDTTVKHGGGTRRARGDQQWVYYPTRSWWQRDVEDIGMPECWADMS
jgi:hypothetical protein